MDHDELLFISFLVATNGVVNNILSHRFNFFAVCSFHLQEHIGREDVIRVSEVTLKNLSFVHQIAAKLLLRLVVERLEIFVKEFTGTAFFICLRSFNHDHLNQIVSDSSEEVWIYDFLLNQL